MTDVTKEQMRTIMPYAHSRIDVFIDPLNAAMADYQIDRPARQAAFLAQLAHESGEFRYVAEIADGHAYEGRTDLGNTEPGDGRRFKGRGLIQITGRHNYRLCGEALGCDLEKEPELLEQPVGACRSAAWFWTAHGLNELADLREFIPITKRINGGTTHLAERQAYYARAKHVLGII